MHTTAVLARWAKRKFGPQIFEMLRAFDPRVFAFTDDEYSWWAVRDGVGVQFRITESTVNEGVDEGINPDVVMTKDGGQILGQIAPYNYTPRVWTNDPEEIKERMERVLAGLSDWIAEQK